MAIEIVGHEALILREILDPSTTRLDVAKTIALALRSSEAETINWGAIGMSVINRWSPYAWKWIKEKAWSGKAFEAEEAGR